MHCLKSEVIEDLRPTSKPRGCQVVNKSRKKSALSTPSAFLRRISDPGGSVASGNDFFANWGKVEERVVGGGWWLGQECLVTCEPRLEGQPCGGVCHTEPQLAEISAAVVLVSTPEKVVWHGFVFLV